MAEVGDLRVKLSLDNAQFEKSVTSMNRTLQAMGQEIRGLQNRGKEWGSSIDGLKQKQDAYGRLLEGQQTKVRRLSEEYEKAKRETGEHSAETEKLATQLNRASAEMDRTERELSEITAELQRQERELAISQTSWARFGEAAQQAGAKLKAVGDKMTSIGKELSMKVTAPLLALGGGAVKAAIDFESAFAGVKKTVDTTDEGFAKLEKGILEMARTLPASASDIAAVAESAGQLGIAEDNILSFTRTIIDLGESTNMTAEQGATEFARFANIVGMSQEDFDRLGSSIVGLGNTMATTESEIMGMSMRLAAQGAQVGLSESQILALSATMSSLGINAEAGGTAMSMILSKINTAVGKGGKDLTGFAKAAGMTSTEFKKAFQDDAAGALDTFIKGLAESSEKGANLTTMLADLGIKGQYERDTLLRLAGASELFGEAMKTSATAWEENTALSDEAAQRYETTASQLAMLKNRIVEVGISFGSIMLPYLIQIVDALSPIISKFAEMDGSMQATVLVIAGIAAAIGPVLVVAGMLISSIGSIVGAFGGMSIAIANAGGLMAALKLAFAALTGPIGLAIAAIVGIGIAMVAAYKHFEGFKNVVDNVLNAALGIIQNVMTTIKGFILNVWGQITQFWQQNGEQIKRATSNVWTAIKAVIDAVMPAIKLVIDVAMKAIKLVVEQIWDAIKGTIQGVLDVILGLIKTFSSLFTGDWKGLWEGVKQFLTGAVQAIWNIAQLMFFGKLLSGLKTFATSFSGLFTSMWTAIKNLFTSSTGAISKVTTTAFNAIKNVVNMSMNTVKTIVTTVWNVIKNIFTTTVNAIKSVVTNGFNIILSTIKHIMTSVVNAVKGAATHMFSAGKDLVRGLINGIKDMSVAAIEAITGLVDGVITKAKNLLGIKSPSREFMEIGKFTGEGLAIGVKKTKAKNEKAIKDVTAVMTNAAKANAAEVAKIADKAEVDRTKIQQSYAKKRSNMKKANGKKIAELEKEMQDKLKEVNEKAWAEMIKKEDEASKQKLEAIQKFMDGKKKANELSLIDEAQYWRAAYQQFKTGSAENLELRQSYQENVKRINDAIASVNNEYLAKAQKINDDLIKNEDEANKKYSDALESKYQTILGYYGLFDAVTKNDPMEKYELSNNLESQVASLKDWASQIEQLKNRKISANLLTELKEMGPKAIEQLRALNSMTDAELKGYENLYKEKMKFARETAIKELEPLKIETQNNIQAMRDAAAKELESLNNDWKQAIKNVVGGTEKELKTLHQVGKNAGEGLLKGLSSMQGPLEKKAKEIANAVNKTIKSALQINSPSKLTTRYGAWVGEGLAVGMDKSIDAVKKAASGLAAMTTEAIETQVTLDAKNQHDMLSGLAQTITASNQPIDLSGLTSLIGQIVDRPVELLVNLDGQTIARTVSTNQYNSASLAGLTKGVSMG